MLSVMLSYCFLSFEILMQFPHAINNAKVTTFLLLITIIKQFVGQFVAHIATGVGKSVEKRNRRRAMVVTCYCVACLHGTI